MDDYERIAAAFHQRIDSIAGAVDAMADGIARGSALMLNAALQDRRILVFANSRDGALAQLLVQRLRSTDATHPPLPAIFVAHANDDPSSDLQAWQDLRTLSRDGDVLLCIDCDPGAAVALRCGEVAAQRNLAAVSLSELAEGVGYQCNIELRAATAALRAELALMACHCLQEQLVHQMLGS